MKMFFASLIRLALENARFSPFSEEILLGIIALLTGTYLKLKALGANLT